MEQKDSDTEGNEEEDRAHDAAQSYYNASNGTGEYHSLKDLAAMYRVKIGAIRRRLAIIQRNGIWLRNGRPPIISEKIRDIMRVEAKSRDISKNSFTKDSFQERLGELRLEEAKELGKNETSIPALTRTTLLRVLEDVTPELTPAGRSQNQRRFEAITNGLNHISLAAMWPAIVHQNEVDEIKACSMFNFDASSIMLETSNAQKEKLYMAEGSKELLKQLGLSPSTTTSREQGKFKRRCVQLTALTRADGVLCGVILKFKDYAFTKTAMFKCVRPPGVAYDIYIIKTPAKKGNEQNIVEKDLVDSDSEDEEDLTEFLQDLEVEETEQIILNEKGEVLNENKDDADNTVQPTSNSSSSSSAPTKPVNEELVISRLIVSTIVKMAKASIADDAKNKKKKSGEVDINHLSQQSSNPNSIDVVEEVNNSNFVIAFDGEQFQIKAINEYCANEDNPHIQWFKLAAMCSNTSQPNDKMPSFRIIKSLTKNLYGKRQTVTVSEQPSAYYDSCVELFSDVPKASRRTFLRFLQYLPVFLSNAYTMHHISSGWSLSGLYPYNSTRILNYWPQFNTLSGNNANGIINSLSDLTRQGAAVGYLTDKEIEQKVQPYLPDDIFSTDKDLHMYSVNRWRAVWLNAKGTVERRKQREEELAAKRTETEARKRKRQLNPPKAKAASQKKKTVKKSKL